LEELGVNREEWGKRGYNCKHDEPERFNIIASQPFAFVGRNVGGSSRQYSGERAKDDSERMEGAGVTAATMRTSSFHRYPEPIECGEPDCQLGR
jgi:hypothetical protein